MSFNTKNPLLERYDERLSSGTRSRGTADNLSPEHAYVPAHVIRYLNSQHDHVTPAIIDEDVESHDNEATNDIVTTPRSNILSHMAKSKTSWVENQECAIPQRRTPLLCSGKNVKAVSTPFERSQNSHDRAPKGFREGKRFDLLPISKRLAQNHRELKPGKQKRFPLIRISSYQTFFEEGSLSSERETRSQKTKTRATFFTQKDVFKPVGAREKPTVGQRLFVADKKKHVKSFSSLVGLPAVNRKAYTAPTVTVRYNNVGVSFPVLV